MKHRHCNFWLWCYGWIDIELASSTRIILHINHTHTGSHYHSLVSSSQTLGALPLQGPPRLSPQLYHYPSICRTHAFPRNRKWQAPFYRCALPIQATWTSESTWRSLSSSAFRGAFHLAQSVPCSCAQSLDSGHSRCQRHMPHRAFQNTELFNLVCHKCLKLDGVCTQWISGCSANATLRLTTTAVEG